MPRYLRSEDLPFERMDSPVYRCCLEALCRSGPVESFLEVGVKRGASLEVVMRNTTGLRRVVLCDFWTINAKKREELAAVKLTVARYAERHPDLEVLFMDGSSLRTLQGVEGHFDLVGIDGSHRRDVFRHDLLRALEMVGCEGHIVIDDLVLHEDHKIDAELLRVCRERLRDVTIHFRDITHWPGAAILGLQRSGGRLKSAVATAIASAGAGAARWQLPDVSDREIVDALDAYRETQDWQAVDMVLSLAVARRSAEVDAALKRLLARESLEIDNERIREHLIAGAASEADRQELRAMAAINGLDWVGGERRLRVVRTDQGPRLTKL